MTLAKTCTFALLHFTIAFTVVYLMTGSVVIGGAVALIEPVCNTIAFFIHEQLWDRWQRNNRTNLSAATVQHV